MPAVSTPSGPSQQQHFRNVLELRENRRCRFPPSESAQAAAVARTDPAPRALVDHAPMRLASSGAALAEAVIWPRPLPEPFTGRRSIARRFFPRSAGAAPLPLPAIEALARRMRHGLCAASPHRGGSRAGRCPAPSARLGRRSTPGSCWGTIGRTSPGRPPCPGLPPQCARTGLRETRAKTSSLPPRHRRRAGTGTSVPLAPRLHRPARP